LLEELAHFVCSKIGINLDFGTRPVHFFMRLPTKRQCRMRLGKRYSDER